MFEGGGPRRSSVLGRDSRLGQVIDNLIENARSFSPAGSTVRVTCRRLRRQRRNRRRRRRDRHDDPTMMEKV